MILDIFMKIFDSSSSSLFNSISTFVGYLMPKSSFLKNSSGSISPIAGRSGFMPFPNVLV